MRTLVENLYPRDFIANVELSIICSHGKVQTQLEFFHEVFSLTVDTRSVCSLQDLLYLENNVFSVRPRDADDGLLRFIIFSSVVR